jgi:hypothetical protein
MKIHVKVIAGASKDLIEKVSDGLKVHLKEKAIKGKANKALVEMLAKYFNKKKGEIEIISGMTSNKKIISI